MNLLLDTHVLLWALSDAGQLAERAAAELAEEDNHRWFSPITAWEITMLVRKEKIRLPRPVEEWFPWVRREFPVQEAPITSAIAVRAGAMPGDPADAFLVATAIVSGFTLVTADQRLLDLEGVDTLPAS